jgi:LDH2 family malate/lactate/ureidoglycolate dehydrogenase
VKAAAETTIPADRLRAFASGCLEAAGMRSGDAEIAAEAMVWADLRGLEAHGVGHKLPQCLARIRAGGTDPRASLALQAERATMGLFDAGSAWGQVAAAAAMGWAIDRARTNGVGLAVVRNASSAAAMGFYPSLAIRERMIGIAITDGPPLMAPLGGTTKLLGNMAHAIGVPAGRHAPLLFDSSLTVMSTGEMDVLAERAESLPDGVLLDGEGHPTRDPGAWVDGLLLPAGGHRGYGLALMFELLTGVMAAGERFGPDVGSPNAVAKPQGVSLLAMAVDSTVSIPYERFVDRVDGVIDAIHAARPSPGVDRVYVPGERGFLTADRRARDGIPFTMSRLEGLRALGAELGADL